MSLRECVEAGIPLGPNGGVIHHAYQQDRHSGAGNCVCGRHEAHLLHAEAEHHGAMVALYPRADDAYRMAVPNGEPVKELHLTLVYLGEDASQMPPPDTLHLSIARLADAYTVIDAPVIGRAIFDEGAVVYLIGDNPQLPDLHDDVLNACHSEYEVPRQHHPWKPHITIGYEISPRPLDFKGVVLFDRIGVAFGGKTKYFPLMGATVSEYDD